MSVIVEHELAPVAYPDGPFCAWCGRPGTDAPPEPYPDPVAVEAGYQPQPLAGHLAPCCDRHDLAMCDPCRDTPGSVDHRPPTGGSR